MSIDIATTAARVPDYGFLLASQFYPENLPLKESEFIEPFVELEPAFVFKRDVGGAHVTAADIMAATDFVVPGTQITGRFAGWGEIGFDYLASP